MLLKDPKTIANCLIMPNIFKSKVMGVAKLIAFLDFVGQNNNNNGNINDKEDEKLPTERPSNNVIVAYHVLTQVVIVIP